MTRKKAKDIALSILARWQLRTMGKQTLVQAAAHQMFPPEDVSRGRRAFLRALAKPVRL